MYREYNHRRHDELIRGYDGVEEVLDALKAAGRRTGHRHEQEPRHDGRWRFAPWASTDRFDVVVTASDTTEHKPSPVPLLLCLQRLGATADGLHLHRRQPVRHPGGRGGGHDDRRCGLGRVRPRRACWRPAPTSGWTSRGTCSPSACAARACALTAARAPDGRARRRRERGRRERRRHGSLREPRSSARSSTITPTSTTSSTSRRSTTPSTTRSTASCRRSRRSARSCALPTRRPSASAPRPWRSSRRCATSSRCSRWPTPATRTSCSPGTSATGASRRQGLRRRRRCATSSSPRSTASPSR